MIQFEDKRPKQWQKINVMAEELSMSGYYYFSNHHTYPHELHSEYRNHSSRLEQFNDLARWEAA